jgi:hypothetical protein
MVSAWNPNLSRQMAYDFSRMNDNHSTMKHGGRWSVFFDLDAAIVSIECIPSSGSGGNHSRF